jgi:hypothetical protein
MHTVEWSDDILSCERKKKWVYVRTRPVDSGRNFWTQWGGDLLHDIYNCRFVSVYLRLQFLIGDKIDATWFLQGLPLLFPRLLISHSWPVLAFNACPVCMPRTIMIKQGPTSAQYLC